MNTDFRPPKTNPLVVGAVYPCLPAIMRFARRVVGVEVDGADWERLAALREQRFVLTPNHPSSSDPLIALWVAWRLRRPFNYMACRELFRGGYGWVLQRLGAYSVLRGELDRQAVKTTLSLLAEHDRRVVIFPEGEIYGHNDLLLPFQSGVVQLGFLALDRLEKAGRDLSLPVVPLAVKYLHVRDARPAIGEALGALEVAMGLKGPRPASDYLRLRRVGETALAAVEQEYRIRPEPEQNPAARVDHVKREILKRVAQALDVPCPSGPFAEGLHALLSAAHDYSGEFAEGVSDYHRRLHLRRMTAVRPLYQDLWRLQNIIAVSDGYVAAHMTTERFVEVLNRLETEVFGGPRTLIPSRALLRVAAPLELGACFPDYRTARKPTIATTTQELESRLRQLMEEMSRLGQPIE